MNTKEAKFKTLIEDVKLGFKFALKNFISFFLGVLGLLIVSGILIAIIVGVGAGIFFMLIGNLNDVIAWIIQTSTQVNNTARMIVVGATIFLILPILLPLFIAGGAIFGMGREVIESNGTTVEGVFTWYKSKFLTLAAGGTLAFLVVTGPPIVLMTAIGSVTGGIITDGPLVIFAIISTIWILTSSGITSMLFPAIIDGQSSIEAMRTSIRYAIRYFDRVFSTWFAFVIISTVLMLPMIIFSPMVFGGYLSGMMGAYAAIVGLVVVFVVFPAATITLNRVYLILSGEHVTVDTQNGENIEFVGGV